MTARDDWRHGAELERAAMPAEALEGLFSVAPLTVGGELCLTCGGEGRVPTLTAGPGPCEVCKGTGLV